MPNTTKPDPKPFTAAAAKRYVAAQDAEWQAVSERWFSGAIRTQGELAAEYEAVKARYPRMAEACSVKVNDTLRRRAQAAERRAMRAC